MIILSKKKIIITLAICTSIIAFLAIAMFFKNTNSLKSVTFIVNNKKVVLDARAWFTR